MSSWLRLLLVTPDPQAVQTLGAALQALYILDTADTAETGLEALHKGRHDALLLGLHDAGQALAMLQRVRAEPAWRHLPVVILCAASGTVDEAFEDRALQLGATDFLTPPWRASVVRARIANVLHLRELIAFLNQRGAATFLLNPQQGLIGTMRSNLEISYIADTVLLLRFFEAGGRVRKALSVIKNRGGAHEDTIREVRITAGQGVQVGEPLTAFRGVLSGTPSYSGDADPLLETMVDVHAFVPDDLSRKLSDAERDAVDVKVEAIVLARDEEELERERLLPRAARRLSAPDPPGQQLDQVPLGLPADVELPVGEHVRHQIPEELRGALLDDQAAVRFA